MLKNLRIPAALLAFAVWLAIMVWGFWVPHDPTAVTDTITAGVAYKILAAGAFLLAVVLVMGWRDIGFNPPRPWASLKILRFPAVYLALFFAGTLLVGWPSPNVVFFLALNTILVGFSEELMFRGVLYRAFTTALTFWPAIWLTSALFGAVHVLNVFTTGDLFSATLQALTAFMAGTFFLAVVLKTHSILPSMLLHTLWDFLLTTMAAGAPALDHAAAGPSLVTVFLPFALEAPLFIYSVVVLRKLGREAAPLRSATAANAQPIQQ